MLHMTAPLWEVIARAAIIYGVMFAAIRFAGKRELGELTPFDLIFLLLISEQVSPALTGGDDSVLAAFVGLATLLALNKAVTIVTARSHRAERILEGRPQFLVRKGRVDYARLRAEAISKNDLLAALRQNGCLRPSQVEWAVLETSGAISVKKSIGGS
jgi:uncharacterized membrane protein YcaP (DUF421 family)